MITTTIGNLVEAAPVLREFSSYEFPAKTAFKLARIIQASEQELKIFTQMRNALIQKYGDTDENGQLKIENNSFVIKKEFINNYQNDINEILNSSIDIVANPIEIEELSELRFTPTKLVQLHEFINE